MQFAAVANIKQAVTSLLKTLDSNSFYAVIQASEPQWRNVEMPLVTVET
jgi:hypothetical protein